MSFNLFNYIKITQKSNITIRCQCSEKTWDAKLVFRAKPPDCYCQWISAIWAFKKRVIQMLKYNLSQTLESCRNDPKIHTKGITVLEIPL